MNKEIERSDKEQRRRNKHGNKTHVHHFASGGIDRRRLGPTSMSQGQATAVMMSASYLPLTSIVSSRFERARGHRGRERP